MRILVGILFFLFFLVIDSVLYLSTVGFPDWLVSKLAERISSESFVLSASSIKLDAFRGLVVNDARFFKKGVIGPPAVDAGEIILTIDPLAVMGKRICLKKITVREGIFRPQMACGPEPGVGTKSDLKIEAQLELEMDDCEVQGLHLEKLSCKFLADDSTMRLENLKGTVSHDNLQDPELMGNATYDLGKGVLEGYIETSFDPYVLLPVLDVWDMPFTAKMVKRFDFWEISPRFAGKFRKPFGYSGVFGLKGKFWLENCSYNGVEILRGDGRVNLDLSATNSAITFDPILVVREEGLVKGGFTVDLEREVIDFNGTSTINPGALAQMIGVSTNNFMNDLRFEGPVMIAAKGTVGYGDKDLMDIQAEVESRDLGIMTFVSDRCAFTAHVSGCTNTLSDIRGKICGGDFTGSAELVLPSGTSTNTYYIVEGEIRNVELEKFATATMEEKKQDYCGRLSGRVKVEGLIGEGMGRTAVGTGNVSIKDGRIFTFPLFGGFTDIMTKIIPGLDFILSQTDAKSEFEISDGKIHTDEVLIEGDIFSVDIRGNYYFNKDLDFKLRLNLFKSKTLVGKTIHSILHPLSWLLEFRLRGSFDNPEWSPTNFSIKDLLNAMGLRK